VVFDLFHTLVDPEDFRPRDFDRLEQVSGVLGVALEPFRRFWEGELAELAVCPIARLGAPRRTPVPKGGR